MRYFVYKGIETITYGPGDFRLAHVADEYININDIVTMSNIYLEIVKRLLC